MLYFILEGSIGVFMPVGLKSDMDFLKERHSHVEMSNAKSKKLSLHNLPTETKGEWKSNALVGNTQELINKTKVFRRQSSILCLTLEQIQFLQVATLSKGTNFGELALVTNRARYIHIYKYILYIYIRYILSFIDQLE